MASSPVPGLADRTTSLVGWTIAWRAASAVTTLALSVALAHQLGADQYGRYTLVLGILIYLAVVATVGQDQGLLRYLPEVLARGDRAAAHDLLRKSAVAVVLVWVVSSAAVLLLRPLIDQALNAHVGDLLALGTVLLLATIAAGVLSFALVAIYDMRSQALATPFAGVLTLLLALVFLRRGGHLESVLLAGAVGQSSLAAFYLSVLLRRIRAAAGQPGEPIAWRRLLVYASGWLPSLLIASAVGLQFENIFLQRFHGSAQVAFYDTGYAIPQRLVALIPSILTGAWVVGTLEGAHREGTRLRSAVIAFFKGIFFLAFPLALGAGALLTPLIRQLYPERFLPAARIAPLLLACFIAALLTTPWGLVVRVRELAWLNALVTIAQLGFATLADLWLIQRYALAGAVAAVALTTGLTIALSLLAWRWVDPGSLAVPWPYAARCLTAALPFLILFPLSFAGVGLLPLVPVAALATVAWLYLVRQLGLLNLEEVPLLHESRHQPIKIALRWLARSPVLPRPIAAEL